MFVNLTEGIDRVRLRTIILHSVITATIAALIFLAFGPVLFQFLGSTIPDFMIVGGILLLAAIAVMLIRRGIIDILPLLKG